MELRKYSILPAAVALSLALAPAAFAGENGEGKAYSGEHHGEREKGRGDGDRDKPRRDGDRDNPRDTKQGPPGPQGPAGRDGRDSTVNISGGGGGDLSRNFTCRIQNRKFYVATQGECNELKISFGIYVGGGEGYGYVRKTRRGHGYVTGGGYVHGGGNVVVGGGYTTGGGYGYYQPQRVIRYVAQPSPAARKQMERRARKAARLAAEQAAAYGYAQGGMVGYGNGVMVGGYGNNVMINGNVYGGAAYAQGGYGYGEQVIVRKKRKGKRARVIIQQPGYIYGGGYVYGGAYGYDGPMMVKGGGY